MKKYVAFLRGINVGNIRIKMPDLKACFEGLGYKNVKTFLQTGNVLFESDQSIDTIKPILEKTLSETFHYQAYVLLKTYESLAEIIKNYPFKREENFHAYIIFIENEGTLQELMTISKMVNEEIAAGNAVIYWKVKEGETLNTPFAKISAKAKYKSTITIRNINTLEKMVERG